MPQPLSKNFSLFLAVVIRLVVWYRWRASCGLRQFALTYSIIRSVEFSWCKCSSDSTDTGLQRNGNIQPIFWTLRFHSRYLYQVKLDAFVPSTNSFLSFTSPIIILLSRSSTLPDRMWPDLFFPTLLLLQSIAVQAQLPPMPKSALFTQIACDSITQTRLNHLALFDTNHKSLGTVFESCSLISGPRKLEGFSNITAGPYTVMYPRAFFGVCLYKNAQIEIKGNGWVQHSATAAIRHLRA